MAAISRFKVRRLAFDFRKARKELAKRQLEVDQRWYDVLSIPDLTLLAHEYDVEIPNPRALEVAQLMEKLMADGVSTPADLHKALYGDEPQAVITPAVVQPEELVTPVVQPMPVQPVQQAPVMAGLVRAKFTGRLAPGSASVPTTEGQKPLVPGETYLFELPIFNRIKSMWPGWWETV